MSGEQSAGHAAATIAVHGGYAPVKGEGITPPIHLSSTFVHPSDPQPGELTYGRGGSPAYGPLEEMLAALEGPSPGRTLLLLRITVNGVRE